MAVKEAVAAALAVATALAEPELPAAPGRASSTLLAHPATP